MSDDDGPRVNPGYPLAQLRKALSGAGEQAPKRVEQWRRVLSGLFDGALRIGSRTPVQNTPPWVTLEVVHGGFATGNWAAARPLQPHEIQKLDAAPRPSQLTDCAALNLYYLGDLGRPELAAMLANGHFRVAVPEEGALLIAAWLMERGEAERAAGLVETIAPFFDRLRFYPIPHPRPARAGTGVYVHTVGESIASLRAKRPQAAVERMNEAIEIWTPLYDRAVGLFLETVEGDMPALQTDSSGQLLRGPDGQPLVAGGWPCRRYPPDWAPRARRLLADYAQVRAHHTLCGKPEKAKENFARLRGYLAMCSDDPGSLTGRDVGMIRKILASYLARHGAPGSERRRATRVDQAAAVARPMRHLLARVLAGRLQGYPEDEGAAEAPSLLGPLTADEAMGIGAPAGAPLPPSVTALAMRCLEAPLDVLVERRIVPSSEAMAGVLPLLTARTRAAAIADPALGRVYEAVYRAFRRRRSLLLLDLESQVRLAELPWIAAIEPWVGSDGASRDAARDARPIDRPGDQGVPADDTPQQAGERAAGARRGGRRVRPPGRRVGRRHLHGRVLRNVLARRPDGRPPAGGSLYERYYGIPYGAILRLDDVTKGRFGVPTSPGFARLCEERAGTDRGGSWSVARNGAIIEQAEILTTHNLAALFGALDLAGSLRPQLPLLARRCFAWICRRQQMRISDWRAELQMMKNTAYAWRQMMFYLSLLD